jgi:hypothetical protein
MKATEAAVVWIPSWRGEPSVRIERHHSQWDRSPDELWMPATCLGEFGEISTKGNPTKQKLAMFILFHSITVRDGVPTNLAHEAFLKIDEYRKTI